MPSTVIKSMTYDGVTNTLRIFFVSGMIYDYKDVPADVFYAMKTSGSKGIYFNLNIKGKYEFEKVN
jgi:hypothetical protein